MSTKLSFYIEQELKTSTHFLKFLNFPLVSTTYSGDCIFMAGVDLLNTTLNKTG